MAPNTFVNIADGQRDRLGVFAEWDASWTAQWVTQLGLRYDSVKMNSGNIAGYSSIYGNPALASLSLVHSMPQTVSAKITTSTSRPPPATRPMPRSVWMVAMR